MIYTIKVGEWSRSAFCDMRVEATKQHKYVRQDGTAMCAEKMYYDGEGWVCPKHGPAKDFKYAA